MLKRILATSLFASTLFAQSLPLVSSPTSLYIDTDVLPRVDANFLSLGNSGTTLPAACAVGQRFLLTLSAPHIYYTCTIAGNPGTWQAITSICAASSGQVAVAGTGGACTGYTGLLWDNSTRALTLGILNLESDPSTANGRLLLSSTAANSGAGLTLLPSGTAPGATFAVRNSSDRLNYGRTQWSLSGATATFGTFAVGTGTPVTQWNWQVGTTGIVAHCGVTGQILFGDTTGLCPVNPFLWNDSTQTHTHGLMTIQSGSSGTGVLYVSTTIPNYSPGLVVLPNGSGIGSSVSVRNSSDQANYARVSMSVSGGVATFNNSAAGSGTPITQWNWKQGTGYVAHCGIQGQILFSDTTGTCASGKLAWSETGDFGKGSLTIGDAVQGFEIEPGIFQGYANFYPTTANTAMEINAYPSGTNTQAGLRGYNSSDTANNAFVSLQAVGPQASLRVVSNGTPLNPITNFVIGPNQGANTLANLASIDFIWGVNPQYKLWSVTPNGVQIGAGNQTNFPSKDTCDGTGRTPGKFWYSGHTIGVKDDVQICAADAANVWAWRVIY